MNDNPSFLLKQPELQQSLYTRVGEIRKLVNTFHRNKREEFKQILNTVETHIVKEVDIGSWDKELCESFVHMVTALAEADANVTIKPMEATDARALDSLAGFLEWLSSLVVEWQHLLDTESIGAVCALWLRTRLALTSPLDPESFYNREVKVLASFGLDAESLDGLTRSYVLRELSRRDKAELTGEVTHLAKKWCEELVTKRKFRQLLMETCHCFGIEISMEEEMEKSPEEEAEKAPPPRDMPIIWQVPAVLSESEMLDKYAKCLIHLRVLSREADSGITEMTAGRLEDLTPESGLTLSVLETLFWACRNLWDNYPKHGRERVLNAIIETSWIVFCANRINGKPKEQSNALLLWMDAQLPSLVSRALVGDILEDASKLCRALNCRPQPNLLQIGALQALAGNCLRLIADEQKDLAIELLGRNAPVLRKIGEQREQWAEHQYGEQVESVWRYLCTLLDPDIEPPPPDFSDQIRQVIKRGTHEGPYELIGEHLETLKDRLRFERLKVCLSPDHLMWPEGEVFLTRARQREVHPQFRSGLDALERGDFRRAPQLFQRLGNQVRDLSWQICKNYEAYALAMQSEPDLLTARTLLDDLTNPKKPSFPYPSAYWNMACCIPNDPDQWGEQLEILATGLERAPHPQLLSGAVFLGVTLDDPRLGEWLRLMPVTEAQLIGYYMDFGHLVRAGRDQMLRRILAYIEKGEPVMPDPCMDPHMKTKDAEQFRISVYGYRDRLLAVGQPESFDFWLSCRERIARHRYEFWQFRADFFEKTGRLEEAAKAFHEEVKCRIGYMRNARTFPGWFISPTRERARQWLNRCLDEDLRSVRGVGQDIYNSLCQFEKRTKEYQGKLVPNDKRIKVGFGGSIIPELRELLGDVGSLCQDKFHKVTQLAYVEGELSKLADALSREDAEDCSEALRALVQSWSDSCSPIIRQSPDAADAVLLRAREGLGLLKGAIERELETSLRRLAKTLLDSFENVNARLAGEFLLLPELTVEAVEGESVSFDATTKSTAFSVRVKSSSGTKPVRIVHASAVLDDEQTIFPLRDKLELMPVTVAPGQPVMLTFEVAEPSLYENRRSIRIELRYLYDGNEYNANGGKLLVAPCQAPKLPGTSPFIFGRPLEPHEIKGHFYGREAEQEEILTSVTGGRLRYLEGIRRSGKTSLLHSIGIAIRDREAQLIPVYVSLAGMVSGEHAGITVHNILGKVSECLKGYGVSAPVEDECRSNLAAAYGQFLEQVNNCVTEARVLVLLDDFQELVEKGKEAKVRHGVVEFLDVLWGRATTQSNLAWVFAGQMAHRQLIKDLPGPKLWGTLRPLPIDFLSKGAVEDILGAPLSGTSVVVPPETVDRVFAHTAGHPEVVQEMGESMLLAARDEKRWILAPGDADAAAESVAKSDHFITTWYPDGELSEVQDHLPLPPSSLMASYVNAVPIGGAIEPLKLVGEGISRDALQAAVDDLINRKILEHTQTDGTPMVRVKAHVLDRWLHRVLPQLRIVDTQGSVVVFVDTANLTSGNGKAYISGLDTQATDQGIPGTFKVGTVIDYIDRYAQTLSPAPVAKKWAVNFPRESAAVMECGSREYGFIHLSEQAWEKRQKSGGADDQALTVTAMDVQKLYPRVTHFVIVSGDIDYHELINNILVNGKCAHVVSRRRSLNPKYQDYARKYRTRFTIEILEDLLEVQVS